jgi:1-acyl-sn-glycerol-3-phosphate acyltransferase
VSVPRSLVFYLVFYAMSVVFSLLTLVFLPFGGGFFRKMPDSWSAFHRWCVRVILGIRVVEEGSKPEGAALYAFKHESFFEAIDLATALEQPVPFAKEELFRIPLWGRAAQVYGSVSVAREDGARALRQMLIQARGFAATGRPLAIFPEGTRVPHGTRPPLRSGFAGIYKLLGLPVVPVAVDSGPLYHRWWKKPGTITLRFGEPIPPGLPREELEERVHTAINALNL